MKREQLQIFNGFEVKLTCKDGTYTTGVLKFLDDDTISIFTRSGQEVFVSIDSIAFLKRRLSP